MTLKLLTEHHLEFLSLKGGCTGLSESTLVKNATLLEITCHGSLCFNTYIQCHVLNGPCSLYDFTKLKLKILGLCCT